MPSAADVMRQWLQSPRPAVIFDFNGTLSDDEPILLDISPSRSAATWGGR